MIEKFGISAFLALLVGAPLGLALSLAGLPLLFPSILAVGIGSYVWLGRSRPIQPE